MILLATAVGALSWDRIRALPHRLEALPIGLVFLVCLFAAYIWSKSRQIAELHGLLRGLEQRDSVPPSEKQLDQLFSLISSSQQGYRDLIDTFEDLLFTLSLDGAIRAANRSFAQMFGLPFSEVVGHRLDEFLDTPGRAGRATAEKALAGFVERRHWSGIIQIVLKKSGAVHYFDCTLHAMVKDGQVVGITGLAKNITQQRENEARFTELFETLQEGVYFTTPEGKILDANPALVRMLGYDSKEELLGMRVRDLYFDVTQRALQLQEVEMLERVHGREITLRRKDGRAAVCLDTSTAIRDASGRALRYEGTLLDITERKEMEKRLHAEQEFARRLVDSLPDIIDALDTQGRYTFVSQRIKDALGYPPEELIGHALGERAHPDSRPALLELFNDLISGRRTHGVVEYYTRHKNGDWRLFRGAAGPLFDAEGKIAGVIASSRDVTEVKRLEQQVIQSEKLAAMGQMIAGVAHELNNPLTAVLGVSELLRDGATDETTRRQLDLAYRQARRAAHIVQSLLAFSRPTTPGKALLNLSDLLQRTLQLHEHSLRSNNISVDFLPKPDLPAVIGDASQLTQVFLNLFTNAEQAIREIHDRGTMKIGLTSNGKAVSISLQDDGSGISPEALPRIFDPFFTTKRPGRGTGLGLSICMAIVREHGGNIEVHSVPGRGSTFTVTLPVQSLSTHWSPSRLESPEVLNACATEQEGAAATPALAASGKCTPQALASLHGRSVLVVDDEESICELVHDGLSAQGLLVDRASTGEQALRMVATRFYDAVLCDLHLTAPGQPAMSGGKICDELQAHCGEQKPFCLLMTGDLIDPATAQILRRNGTRIIQKPFRISDLLALLHEGLQVPTRK